MKQFVLSNDMLSVLGDCSSERLQEIIKSLTYNWAFVVYPESCPEHWIEKLQSYFFPFAISPLHDKDVNADGTPKKPHYHVMLTFENKKSFQQLFDIAKSVNGTNLINLLNARGYYRYFCHLDNPEKAQYIESDIRCYNGFDSDIYNKPNSAVRYQAIRDMIKFVIDNDITEFWQFMDLCSETHYDDWFKLLCDNCALVISNFIKSRRHSKECGLTQIEIQNKKLSEQVHLLEKQLIMSDIQPIGMFDTKK